MYERFTDRARKVMQLANQEAQRFNHEYIGAEHVLLGLLKEGSGVAANVLKNLNISLRNIRDAMEKILVPGPAQNVTGRLPHTPQTRAVVDAAIEEARAMGNNWVGTEHLLLGLMRGSCSQVVLSQLGLEPDKVREEVRNLSSGIVAKEFTGAKPVGWKTPVYTLVATPVHVGYLDGDGKFTPIDGQTANPETNADEPHIVGDKPCP